MNLKKSTLMRSLIVLFVTVFSMIACQKETTDKNLKLQKYVSFKQNMLKQWNELSVAYLDASRKNFGTAHDGKINIQQFESDFVSSFAQFKKPFLEVDKSSKVKLSTIKPWIQSQEELSTYLERNNASFSVAEYLLKINNHIEKVVADNPGVGIEDLKLSLAKVVYELQNGVEKIELQAMNDDELSETDVFSILAVTNSILGLSGTISESAQLFFKNVTSHLGNGLQTRCWLCNLFKTVVNVVVSVVVSVATLVWRTVEFGYGLARNVLEGDGWEGIGRTFVNYGLNGWGTFIDDWVSGEYKCYYPEDLWQCPR
jgi:hypothetical protein